MRQRIVELNEARCILGPTNVGLYKGYLIDTSVIDVPLDIAAILITHGHGDHFTWARTIQKRTKAAIVAPKEDAFLIENPEINVRGMFNWARPPVEMTTKLFIGDACKVDHFTEEFPFTEGVTPVHLPGHTMGHTGYLCDGVLFAGDALYPQAIWERHKLPYSIDVELTRRSLKTMQDMTFDWLVPSHGTIMSKQESAEQIELHLTRLAQIDDMIVRLLSTPRSTEDLIFLVLQELGIEDNLARYWLSVTTIKGHLSGLVSTYKVAYTITNHRVYWQLSTV